MPIPADELHTIDLTRYGSITILALGRGVQPDGSLTDYVKQRVAKTLEIARDFQHRGVLVQIIWTGGASRVQVSSGEKMTRSEAEAMLSHAATLALPTDRFEQITEKRSITTVENLANCKPSITGELIVIVTDELHYRWKRVEIIAWLTYPGQAVTFLMIKSNAFGWKQRVQQFASTVVLLFAMAGVRRGDAIAIMCRQRKLERLFGVR
jgi:hypothetical protein